MSHVKTFAVASISGADSVSCPPALTPVHVRVVTGFARIWRVLRWCWGLTFLTACGLLALALTGGTRAPWYAFFPTPDPTQSTAALAVITLLSCYALAADRYVRWSERARHDDAYDLRPVRQIKPGELVPAYALPYLPRRDAATGLDADATTRAAIHHAAHKRHIPLCTPLGVCIYGPAAMGKTRLAWEVVRAELREWTFVNWPCEGDTPFDFTRVRGRHVVLWLDDIHAFATPTDGALLADLPRQFERAGARLVIVATCRDGADETRACQYLGGLLTRLTPIRLAGISSAEASQLIAALAKRGVALRRDQFDERTGTPGSLVLCLQHMRTGVFPQLSGHARHVLQAMCLLRSAHIYSYPEVRVLAVAADLFGVSPSLWPTVRDELEVSGFIRMRKEVGARARHMEPVANAYLDVCVPSHLNPHAEVSDDWPWLLDAFERTGDVTGLTTLGIAFVDEERGIGPFSPYSPRHGRQLGVLSFRAALASCTLRTQPHPWARAQLALGLALSARASVSEGLLRADFWRQALAAYRSALEVFSPDDEPALWALTQRMLAELHQQRASDALFAGNCLLAEAELRTATRSLTSALSVYTAEQEPIAQGELQRRLEELEQALGQIVV